MISFSIVFIAILFFVSGSLHFIKSDFFTQIIPPLIPFKRAVVYFTGLVEIVLTLGFLYPTTRQDCAIGLIVFLMAVFPANIYMYVRADLFPKMHKWALLARLPLQPLLMYWIYKVSF